MDDLVIKLRNNPGSRLERGRETLEDYIPSLNSPKLPAPIFLPTLKLGPTIKTPEQRSALAAGESRGCIVSLVKSDDSRCNGDE